MSVLTPALPSLERLCAGVLDGVPHGFCGRRGGVSTGVFAGLNAGLGSGDDPALVAANRARAADAVLPGAVLLGAYQVHSARCVTVGKPWAVADRPQADALVTDRPGLLLGILTADCAPVLLADPAAGVIGAAHAGWRGALAGVTDAAIDAMVALGARRDRIAAAIGPCIAQMSYEVGDDLRTHVVAHDERDDLMFVAGRAGHWWFDLAGYVATRLSRAGITTIEALRHDTYGEPARFYSYRRATHRGQPAYGRQIALIGLAASS